MSLVEQLIRRGDHISLTYGVVSITPASGKSVPKEWLRVNSDSIVRDVANKLAIMPLVYTGFSKGVYGNGRYPGVTLQFESLNGEERHVFFNVQLTRARSSPKVKAGTPYPGKQFSVRKKSHFYKFWSHTGLSHPKSVTVYHDYMGNLKKLYFVAESRGDGRIEADSLRPLNVSFEVIRQAFCPDNIRTLSELQPDNSRISNPDKDFPQAQVSQGVQPKSTTCKYNYETSNQGSAGTRGMNTPPITTHCPQNQTVDEWLANYEG